MKKIYTLLVLILLVLSSSYAQQIFSSSGKVISNGNIRLSYTIGEPLVSNNENGEIILSSGFQHSVVAKITKIKNNLFKPNELLVYPNPSSGILNIENKTNRTRLAVQLSDMKGQIIFSKSYDDLQFQQLNLSQYSNALYILTIQEENAEKINTYKIQLNK